MKTELETINELHNENVENKDNKKKVEFVDENSKLITEKTLERLSVNESDTDSSTNEIDSDLNETDSDEELIIRKHDDDDRCFEIFIIKPLLELIRKISDCKLNKFLPENKFGEFIQENRFGENVILRD
jgi:hypothetical protein